MPEQQEPVAIVGLACRLPGGNSTPEKLWDFLLQGKVAPNKVPSTRFNIEGHFDGSHKPGTMRPPGGMFLNDVDLADFDASFFELSGTEAIAMDPNQRQMLEVVYEGLESAGFTLERLNGASVACFVGSFATDYGDMQNRDPMDRAANNVIGVGRASMANRISYFLNLKGPSVTIDTACSGSLVGLHLAARALHNGEADSAIIAASNIYLTPEHAMDIGSVGQAHSPTALCHTFDIEADGYVKSEAVSAVIVKRLSDAISDGDPIRAILRGTASTSNGRTNGLASPSSSAQAAAIRQAYASAGITNLNDTAYLECHGTGTQAGDPLEVNGAGSVFAPSRDASKPLIISSIKSNVGHSEPAAGNSGLIKAILSMENGIIPGTPLFINPNPKIDFVGNKVKASRTAVKWPDEPGVLRRASVNSFGYGGSNAHAIVEQPNPDIRINHTSSYFGEDETDFDDDYNAPSDRPHLVVVSANDANTLRANIEALCRHTLNPRVRLDLADLSYTLSERRSRLWHRAFVTSWSTDLKPSDFTSVKKNPQVPSIGIVFTGQGAQWPQMGKDLISLFPETRNLLGELDQVLQNIPNPPQWSLVTELTEARTPEHLRQPEFSQPLVTALQLAIFSILESWNVKPSSVVGHSSGEIAAAYAAGFLSHASAIKAAFYRGRAAVNCVAKVDRDVGMLAVGVSAEVANTFLEKYTGLVWIACFNSPSSLTISGKKPALEALAKDMKVGGHFARLLQVDLAYHSELMKDIGEEYELLLRKDGDFHSSSSSLTTVAMFSSVNGSKKDDAADASYWKTNMISPVRFEDALSSMIKDPTGKPDLLIEVGPSGALSGPVSQTLKTLTSGTDVSYTAAWSRGPDASLSLFNVAGRLFGLGLPIELSTVNRYGDKVRTIIDLPSYKWNRSVKYWHENASSRDWRLKPYLTHDLLGSKVLGSSWYAPTWRKRLVLNDVPWLKDHVMGSDVLLPGTGYVTMALEAMYQKYRVLNPDKNIASPNELAYRFRNVRFERALVVESDKPSVILLTLAPVPGSSDWHEFRVSTEVDGTTVQHCYGMVRVQDPVEDVLPREKLVPLEHPVSAKAWYKAMNEIGLGFGPAFQKLISIEATSGQRNCRTRLSLEPPATNWDPQTYYPIHPAVLDACFQTVNPAHVAGERSMIQDVMVPANFDDILINKVPKSMQEGLSLAESIYTGRGRRDQLKSYYANVAIHDPETGALVIQARGIRCNKLDVGQIPDPHTFNGISWKPDVSLLTQDQLNCLQTPNRSLSGQIGMVVDLVAHKRPTLKVLEINLNSADASSIWFEGYDNTIRSAHSQYDLALANAATLVDAHSRYGSRSRSSFMVAHPSQRALGISETVQYDLVIVKAPKRTETTIAKVMQNLKPLINPDSFVVLVATDEDSPTSTDEELLKSSTGESSPTGLPSDVDDDGSSSSNPSETPPSSMSSTVQSLEMTNGLEVLGRSWSCKTLSQVGNLDDTFSFFAEIQSSEDGKSGAYLAKGIERPVPSEQGRSSQCSRLVIHNLDRSTPSVVENLRSALDISGWTIEVLESIAPSDITPNTAILIPDELFKPVLKSVSQEQWTTTKAIIESGAPVLWITNGAQHDRVTNPDTALVQGLFRVARREDPTAKLTTLDVQSNTSPATYDAISRVLQLLRTCTGLQETEFVERDGLLCVQRVVPDTIMNDFKKPEIDGADSVVKGLHATDVHVRIHGERVGTLDFAWCEEELVAPALDFDFVEVEVKTIGVNFKDVATTMGIVPENEYTIGCECAGTVRRLGPGVSKFKIGDRVAVMSNGTYSNRVRVPTGRAHVIPDWMSFEDAATIPLVYMTSMYSLFNLGNLKEGESVLIHSAAGGVGLAAIQLAKYKNAEIFITVGTNEKRDFISSTFDIPHDHIFSSRSTKFAEQIMHVTNGRGIDVILNSLVGELLDASWRICADGGTMVEIGKRDIVDRNSLSMEPFDRNCSFRAVDLSYTKHFTSEMIGKLFEDIFDLVDAGHIKAINPIIPYGFDQVPAALAHIRRGQHIGKLVITNYDKEDIELPIRPAKRQLQLRSDVSYLIVGGLKGLCGSLAIYMAYHGARHIIVSSRSGINDDASARIIHNCRAIGCEITGAPGDIANAEFVRGMFDNARPRITGIIQGAMVLRDKPFTTMSVEDFHTAIEAKVKGTWNLHEAASDTPLDFFTMLSSVSGVVGNKGQANYAAGNTFLDSFAFYRKSLGLVANTIDLGAIEDVGYVAEAGSSLESRFDKRQWTLINERMLRRILSYSIMQQDPARPINPQSSAQLITGIAYPLQASTSDMAEEPRFGYLFGGDTGGLTDEDVGEDEQDQAARAFRLILQHSTAQPDTSALNKAAVDLLCGQVKKVLRLEDEVEAGKPLHAYGLDSLSAVELRGWMRTKLGTELSTLDITNASSLVALGEKMVSKVIQQAEQA